MNGTKPFKILVPTIVITLILLSQTCIEAWGYGRIASDSQVPSIPKGLTVTNRTFTTASFSWTASRDNVKIKGYQVYRDGRKITSTTKTSYTNTSLTPGRKYTYAVKAYDAAGNLSDLSCPINITTLSDVESPQSPGNLAASAATHTTITLSWDTSTDNTGIKGYDIYCNGKKKGSTSTAHYVTKSLTPGTQYTFYVKACDIAGNYSGQSNSITANTAVDASAPTTPANLKVTSSSETEVNLSWSPSTDNVKIKSYYIYRDGKNIGTTTKTSYCSKGLLPGSSYKFSVTAVDTSLNASASSNAIKATTNMDLERPSAPTGLKLKSVRGSYAALEWTASKDNIKVAGYQIFCNGIMIESTTRTSRTVKSPFGTAINIFYIKAIDQSGNLSNASKPLTVLTAK